MTNRFTACAAALAAAGFIACAAPASAAELTVALSSAFSTMDPWDSTDNVSLTAAKSFYEGLYGFDRNMKVRPVLAESAEPSADGLVYTVKLRRGVMFHDGTEFKADAVKANFDRVLNPENHLKRFGLYSNVAKVDVVDDYTVKFTLKKPFSAFINQLAHPSGAMICPSALKTLSNKELAFKACGTGPFTMDKYSPVDGLRVVKNPNYWQKGLPKVDAIMWKPVVENSTRVAMLKTGEAQFAFPLPPEQAAQLKSEGDLVVVDSPSIILRYVSINQSKKPFDNLKVREALNYAVNKNAFIKVAFNGFGDPADGVAPKDVAYSVQTGPWPYDPKKACELLKEAGYPNGFETTLLSGYNDSTSIKAIQFLQQQLAQVGIKAKVQALEVGQRTAMIDNAKGPAGSKHQLYYIGWSSSTGEIDWAIRPLLATESFTPNNSNDAYYSNKNVDQWLQDALGTTDDAKKAEIYARIQKQIWADAPWIFLGTQRNISGSAKNLSGLYVMPDSNLDFYGAELK